MIRRRGFGIVAAAAAFIATLVLPAVAGAVFAPPPPSGPAPLVRGFSPAKGPTGTVVVVNGRYFTGATSVTVGGASSPFTVVDDRTLALTVAVAAVTGPVAVTTPSGTGSGPDFTVDARTIRGFAPTSGPPGTIVTLTGFNFLGTTDVRFAGVSSPAFAVIDDRTIYAQVPFGAGLGAITVHEGLAVGTSLPFTYDPVTRIRGFFPTSGGPGTVVTINGTNFDGASGVDFAGTSAFSVVVVSNTQLRAVVPFGASSGPIVVHGVGNDASFGPTIFTVRHDPADYPLSVARIGAGAGSVASTPAGISCGSSCVAVFSFLSTVTLTATADPGSEFAGWTGDCAVFATATCTVTMSQARNAVAIFVPVVWTLTVGRVGSGSGIVTSSPPGIFCGPTCSADYSDGTVVTLSASPDPTATFAGWSGACSGLGTCSVTLSAVRSVSATFTRVTFALTVTNAGGGTVTSSPVGIFCGAACSASFDSGTAVTLTATPDAGALFEGWSGACSGTGTCSVTMDAAKSVGAVFSYPLTVSRVGSGSGTVTSSPAGISCGSTCSAAFATGAVVTLTATPDSSSVFAGWSGACSGVGACSVSMSAVRSVSATFTRVTFVLTVTNGGGGTVSSSPAGIFCGAACSVSFDSGTAVTLTATPDAGASFVGWSGACSGTGACTVTMDAAKSVGAAFSYPLSVSLVGSGGGTVTSSPAGISCGATCTAAFGSGVVVTLTASSDATSTFAGWSGACSGAAVTCVVSMSAVRSVSATFTRVTFVLSVTRTGTGSGTVTSTPIGISCGAVCSASFDSGTVVTLTASSDATSTFAGWSGACAGTGTCVVSMSSVRSVSATFSAVTFTLSVTTIGGSVTSAPAGISCGATCSAAFGTGTVVTLTASASPGATFSSWVGCDSVSGATCTVTMSSARSVTAKFTFPVSVSLAGTGSGTVTSAPAGISCAGTCSASFGAGSSVTLSAVPSASSSFAGWSGACTGTGACAITVDAVKSVSATFTLNTFSLSVARGGNAAGSVTSAPAGISCGATCSALFGSGSVVTLTASGAAVSAWAGCNSVTATTCTVSLNANRSVSVTFV